MGKIAKERRLSTRRRAGFEFSFFDERRQRAAFSDVGVSPEQEEAALLRGLFAAVNVAFHKMLVAATRRFTSVNREDCFMNLRFQYSRCGKPREVESF